MRAAQNHLLPENDVRIAEINHRIADLPVDVADLTLVALPELLKSAAQPG